MPSYQVICAEVLAWAREYKQRIDRGEAEPFHALLSDCPWHLRGGFMNSYWDHDGVDAISFQAETWATLAEVLHPGAFLMVFAGSRGWHRLAVALEDAGLILQPSIFVWGLGVVEVPLLLGWLNSQSFPKASRLDKKLDERAGKLGEREVTGHNPNHRNNEGGISFPPECQPHSGDGSITAPATPLARAWEGHRYGGQVLKDSLSPIIVAQKPWTNPRLDCIVETGAGAINVDAGRISTTEECGRPKGPDGVCYGHYEQITTQGHSQGRWPSNFCLVHKPPSAPGPDGEGGCVRAGTRKVKKNGGRATQRNVADSMLQGGGNQTTWVDYADADGMETVDAWQCEPDCPAFRLGKMSGDCRSSRHINRSDSQGGESGFVNGKGFAIPDENTYSDKGTAARYYKQAGWEHERIESGGTNDENYDQAGGTNKEGEFDEGHCPPIPADGGCARPIGNDEMQCAEGCVCEKLDEQAGERKSGGRTGTYDGSGFMDPRPSQEGKEVRAVEPSTGGASRFYAQADWSAEIAERLATEDPVRYCPKAARRERNQGLDDFYWRKDKQSPTGFMRITRDEWETLGKEEQRVKAQTGKRVSLRAQGNIHPTQKPIALTRWLASLLSPPKEYAPRCLVIPFCGIFSEGIGAMRSGQWEEIVGIDFIQDYVDMSEARAAFWSGQPVQLELMED